MADYLRFADTAMYEGKASGRNTYRIYQPEMATRATERLELEQDLRLAISAGQFELYYQPQVHVEQGTIGAEALLRWHHPTRGEIPPVRFIPLAEDCGLIDEIGYWVLAQAFEQMREWHTDPVMANLKHLSINVSSLQFRRADFTQRVESLCKQSGVSADGIILELTESAVIEHLEDAITKMQQLRALGFRFSLDDFGTGYSSLAYLTRLPLDQIKIDRSFISDLEHNDNAKTVIQIMLAMGSHLGIDTIPEGVETADQLAFLRNNGSFLFQGYLFSRPVNRAEFELYSQQGPLSKFNSD